MSVEIKFILFQALILLPFISGSILKNKSADPEKLAKKIVMVNISTIEPFVIIWSIWGIKLTSELIFLPVSGFLLVILGFLLGKIFLPLLNLRDKERPTFLISSSLANHGFTMGLFLCYLFIGEKGLALSSIFLIYFMPYTYLFIFSYARYSGMGNRPGFSEIKNFLLSYQNIPIYSVAIAIILHLAGAERPGIKFPIDTLILVSIALYYFTLGINFNFTDIKIIKMEQLILGLIKFTIIPIAAYSILQYVELEQSIKTVILIQSFMPAAIYSVITSILFDLDTKLASNLFVVNTMIFLLFILPLIYFFRGFFII